MPKTFSIEPTKTSRPVSIKDFVLPENTKMTISFSQKGKPAKKTTAKAPVKTKTATKRKAPVKTKVVVKQSPGKGKKAQPAKKTQNQKKQGQKTKIVAKKSPNKGKGKGKKN